jgi:hypothetical protein
MADELSPIQEQLDDVTTECGICFENTTLEDLSCCKGAMCEGCLNDLRMRDPNPICPFCRQNIDKENYDRKESDVKVAKANPVIQDWLERQARATPGIQIREALQIYRYLKTLKFGDEEPPNFDYLFIGYYRTIHDLWDDVDKNTEYKRLVEFSMSLDNYHPFYQVLPAKTNSMRLFPDREIEMKQSNISHTGRQNVTKPGTKPVAKPPSIKKRPPPLASVKSLNEPVERKGMVTRPKPVAKLAAKTPAKPSVVSKPKPVAKTPAKPIPKPVRRTPKEKEEESDYSEEEKVEERDYENEEDY